MVATGKFKAIEDLSRYPDWTLQVANIPAVITCTDVMAEQHPEFVVTFMVGMIKVGRWANEHKHTVGGAGVPGVGGEGPARGAVEKGDHDQAAVTDRAAGGVAAGRIVRPRGLVIPMERSCLDIQFPC